MDLPPLGTERKNRASFEREDGASRRLSGSDVGPARTPNGLDARSFLRGATEEIRDVA